MGEAIDEELNKAGIEDFLAPQGIIEAYHGQRCDELVHRALKDFTSEQVPFKRFHENAAFYYTMVIAFFIYEAFRENICPPVVSVSSYTTTLRGKIIDVAGKTISDSEQITLKVSVAAWESLGFYKL